MGRFFKCRISRVNCIPQTVICSDATPYPPISSVYTNGTQIRRGTKAKRWWPSEERRGMLYTKYLFIRNSFSWVVSYLNRESNKLAGCWMGFWYIQKHMKKVALTLVPKIQNSDNSNNWTIHCTIFHRKNYSKQFPLEILDLSNLVLFLVDEMDYLQKVPQDFKN